VVIDVKIFSRIETSVEKDRRAHRRGAPARVDEKPAFRAMFAELGSCCGQESPDAQGGTVEDTAAGTKLSRSSSPRSTSRRRPEDAAVTNKR